MSNLYDRVFAEVQVRASTLGGQAGGILLNLLGFAGGESDADAETSAGEPVYGTPGMYCRPLDATTSGCAEYIAARGVDGLQPLAGRDLRITAARSAGSAVGKGTIGIAGYGGAYVEITYDPATQKDVVTVKNGTLSLAFDAPAGKVTLKNGDLSVVLDAGTEKITFVHPQGGASLTPTAHQILFTPSLGTISQVLVTGSVSFLGFIAPGVSSSVSCDAAGVQIVGTAVLVNGLPLVPAGGFWTT